MQRHAGVAGLPWPPKRGGLKRALRSPGRYAAGRCRLPSCYAAKPTRRERVSRRGPRAQPWGGRVRPGLDAGASAAYIAALSSRKNRSGQMQARERPRACPPPTPPRPWEAFHCGPPPQHRARQATDARQPRSAHHPGLDATEQRTTRPPEAFCVRAPGAGAQLRHPPRRRVTIAGLLSFRHSRLASALV